MVQTEVSIAIEMTLAELAKAYCAVKFDDADLRLRKWLAAFGNESAWSITTRQISLAAEAMLEHGYKASTVNRDTSTIGTLYKWAAKKRLAPAGFVSPTLGLVRYLEDIRHVEIRDAEIAALLAGAKAYSDRRFAVFVRLLIETGRPGRDTRAPWQRRRPHGPQHRLNEDQDRPAAGAVLLRGNR